MRQIFRRFIFTFDHTELIPVKYRHHRTGPERPGGAGLGAALGRTAADLADAVRYLVRRGTPGLALGAMALHRFVYGMELITIILASRNLLTDPDLADQGLALFGALMGAMMAGHSSFGSPSG